MRLSVVPIEVTDTYAGRENNADFVEGVSVGGSRNVAQRLAGRNIIPDFFSDKMRKTLHSARAASNDDELRTNRMLQRHMITGSADRTG